MVSTLALCVRALDAALSYSLCRSTPCVSFSALSVGDGQKVS